MIGADTTFLVQLEIAETPEHIQAHQLLWNKIIEPGVPLVLAPQTIAEFIHIVTDAKRFQNPLPASEAISKARYWWNAAEVHRVFPNDSSIAFFMEWMDKYQLGRKRILDTQLAATLWTAGVREIITSNPRDFALFGINVISPLS